MNIDAFCRGHKDYRLCNPCMVYRARNGNFRWNGDPESNGLPTVEEQEEWAEAYIAGWWEAAKAENG